jgi:hypothetical protein
MAGVYTFAREGSLTEGSDSLRDMGALDDLPPSILLSNECGDTI